MLDLQEIENTIDELENADTTFDTCIKLSALYNVRDNLTKRNTSVVDALPSAINDDVTKELADIAPHYQIYINAKRRYQLEKTDKDAMVGLMATVCQEIKEFILTLYSSTDTEEERFLLYNTFQEIVAKIQP